MFITRFEKHPPDLRTEEVRPYAEHLASREGTLLAKRILDVLLCGSVFLLTLPLFLLIALLIGLTSKGPVLFRQKRVGRDGKEFDILKFRTMVAGADRIGVQLTTGDDARITSFGRILRKLNLDEMPQLLNVLKGEMSVVGTRPEVRRYVEEYTPEMRATLLLAPGMLSDASVKYKDENRLLTGAENPRQVYVEQILPDKMACNLAYLRRLSLAEDLRIIGRSIACMFHYNQHT